MRLAAPATVSRPAAIRSPAASPRLPGWRKPAAASGGLADCSLIVPTYARPREIVVLLEALGGLAAVPAEVIVVDGSPSSETAQAISGWARGRNLGFELIYVSSPRGLTRQRNVGIDASRGQLVFFLDDDCIPQPGYFAAIRQVFHEDPAGRIGAVCGAIVNEMGKPTSLRWRVRFALGLAPRGEPGKYYHIGTSVPGDCLAPFQGTRALDIMSGCAMAFRRGVLERERFSQFFNGYSQGEDMEMSLRVGRNWKLLRCGDAHAVHHHVPGGRPGSYPKGRMEVRNRFFIWKRYSPRARFRDRCRFWMDIGFIFAFDLASFLRSPRQPAYLSHAGGVVAGALGCVWNPPRYDEPPARPEYVFELDSFPNDRP